MIIKLLSIYVILCYCNALGRENTAKFILKDCDSVYSYESTYVDTTVTGKNNLYRIEIEKSPIKGNCIETASGVFSDNIIKLSIYKGNKLFIKKNIVKEDFPIVMPKNFFEISILSILFYVDITETAFIFHSWLGTPDTDIGNLFEYKLFFTGEVEFREVETDDDL